MASTNDILKNATDIAIIFNKILNPSTNYIPPPPPKKKGKI